MKSILIKIGAVIGGFLLLIAGFFVVYFKGKSEGKEDEQDKQRDETMRHIEESRKNLDKIQNMTEKELDDMRNSDKRYRDE